MPDLVCYSSLKYYTPRYKRISINKAAHLYITRILPNLLYVIPFEVVAIKSKIVYYNYNFWKLKFEL